MSYKGKIYTVNPTILKYGSTKCQHCNYDYTQEKGMLFDQPGRNRVRIYIFAKYLQRTCKMCNPKYVKDMNEKINNDIEEQQDLDDMWDDGWDTMFR